MQKEVILSRSTLLLDSPEQKVDQAVLFLPGISGGVFSSRFQPLVDMALSEGRAIARMGAWQDAEDVETKTLNDLHAAVEEALETLKGEGFETVTGIGKSFGGGLLLSYHTDMIVKKILWAPAIGVTDEGNIDDLKSAKLGEIAHLLDIKLSSSFVHADPAMVCIIHGTKDEVVPLENSRRAIEAATRGTLKVVEGADHSFKTPQEEHVLIEATRGFLVAYR